jgi:ribosomal protein S18 acetylase RimI-like enzyme
MNSQFNVVNYPTINELNGFFIKNKKNQKTFRYYKNRDFEVVKNHIKTILFYIDETPVCYGHIDKDENNDIWLGIMVCDNCKGLGYGDLMMDKLLEDINYTIFLTVDRENIGAISLYLKKGFYFLEDNENYYKMSYKKK